MTDADFMALALPQILQGFAVPFFFIPLSNIALNSVSTAEMVSASGLMGFLRTMADAIGASIAITIWDDHAKLSRSQLAGELHVQETQATLIASGMSSEAALDYISSLLDKEASTLGANYIFLVLSLVFLFAALLIWLCPKPKSNASHVAH